MVRLTSDKKFCKNKKNGIYPHPDCDKYYECYNGGKTAERLCPPGLLFSPNYLYCDWPANVVCADSGTNDPTTAAPDTPEPDTVAPDTPAPDTPAPVTPAPDTPAPDTPAPTGGEVDENFCQNHADGLYPTPDCSKYYQCFNSGMTQVSFFMT